MVRERRGGAEVDWQRLCDTVHNAVRFLDNVIEVNSFPIPESARVTHSNRKIGLGVMGFADMLIRLGISYASDEGIGYAEKIMQAIAGEALKASRGLAEERGVFPSWKGSLCEAQGLKVRNATLTAIAPTGTISIIAGTSHSIEPLFALAYRRTNVLDGQTLHEYNPIFLQYMERQGWDSERVVNGILKQGTIKGVDGIPADIKRLFATALEIPPEQHLRIQAAFQRYVDNSVSKTINLAHNATSQEVTQIYWRAWELGLKGITVYRYGSKAIQVLELEADEEAYHYDHGSRCDPEECKV